VCVLTEVLTILVNELNNPKEQLIVMQQVMKFPDIFVKREGS